MSGIFYIKITDCIHSWTILAIFRNFIDFEIKFLSWCVSIPFFRYNRSQRAQQYGEIRKANPGRLQNVWEKRGDLWRNLASLGETWRIMAKGANFGETGESWRIFWRIENKLKATLNLIVLQQNMHNKIVSTFFSLLNVTNS